MIFRRKITKRVRAERQERAARSAPGGTSARRRGEAASIPLASRNMVLWPSAAPRAVDGWPSGLRRTIGNRVGSRPRGFESHPVREGKGSSVRTHVIFLRKITAWVRAERQKWESAKRPGGHFRETTLRSSVHPTPPLILTREGSGAWLSPVERCVRVAEVPGSNPGAPIELTAEGGLLDRAPGFERTVRAEAQKR